MSGEFQKRAVALFRDGHRVVPIPIGQKGPALKGWPELADTQTEEQVRELARTANGCGVGIIAKRTAGVDIDVRDPELAQRLAGVAHEHLGHTVERIGEAPKLLLPYRVEESFPKLTSRSFRLPGDQPGDKLHKVEVLADGQQWVAYHIHPDTGRPYHWPEGDLPARDDLPEIDAAKAALFIEQAEAAIIAAGGRIVAEGKLGDGVGKGKTSTHGQAGTYEAVADALRHIPNRDLDYDAWIKIGQAIKAALGEDGRELWDGWSEQYAGYDPVATDKAWTSFKPQNIGAGTIYHHARAAGWKPPPGMALNPEKAKAERPQPEPETGEARPEATTGGPDLSHDALALELGARWRDTARHVALWGRWLTWDGSRWAFDEKLAHMTLTRDFLRDKAAELRRWADAAPGKDPNEREALIKWAEREGRTLRAAPTVAHVVGLARSNAELVATVDQWDAHDWLLGTPAGTVDLRTGEMRPARQNDHITKLPAVAPATAGTAAPQWAAFLERIFRHDPALVGFMQRVAGYALTGSVREHKLVFAWGQGGNGKGVFFNTLAGITGDHAAVAPQDLLLVTQSDRHPCDMAMLRGARLVTAQELAPGKAWDEPKLKSLTGGDPITARFMRQDFFTYQPRFTLLVAGNHRPSFKGVDEAIRRRVLLVPFSQNIPPQERDQDLPEKLKAEWPAILRWAIDGCLAWQREELNPPQSVQDASGEYLDAEDVLSQWLEECCIVSSGITFTPVGALYGSWKAWCEREGGPAWSGKAFSRALAERGFRNHKAGGVRGFKGIGLLPGTARADGPFGADGADADISDVTHERGRAHARAQKEKSHTSYMDGYATSAPNAPKPPPRGPFRDDDEPDATADYQVID